MDPKDCVRRYFAAWNAHDGDAVLECLAPGATWEGPIGLRDALLTTGEIVLKPGETLSGNDIRALVQAFAAALPAT